MGLDFGHLDPQIVFNALPVNKLYCKLTGIILAYLDQLRCPLVFCQGENVWLIVQQRLASHLRNLNIQ